MMGICEHCGESSESMLAMSNCQLFSGEMELVIIEINCCPMLLFSD
jgi:hypothetical protein